MKVSFSILLVIANVAQMGYGSSLNSPVKFCEFFHAKPECDPNAKYRTMNGFCNNLDNPKWGAELNIYQRLMSARYDDGVSTFIKSVKGGDLPNPRLISLNVFSDRNVSSNEFTNILPQFGQFIAEDQGLTADIFNVKTCCDANGKLAPEPRDPMCHYIPISDTDPTYKLMPRECMNFIRTTTDISSNCEGFNNNGGPANQLNGMTAYLDLSGTYGSNMDDLKSLRLYKNGLMKTKTVHGAEYPPYMTKTSICPEDNASGRCYLGGDFRMNEIPGLTSIHILFVREHNRLARELKILNPHWSDNKLFEEARRINTAIFQYISMYQYFPELLGKWNMRKNLLIFYDRGNERVDDYDPTVNANMINEHANAAYRFFHTMVEDNLRLISKDEKVTGFAPLKDTYFRPGILQEKQNLDSLVRGMCRQAAKALDSNLDDGIREFLFRGSAMFASDLKALDIQRGRDHGSASYNDVREYCGLPRAQTWSGFADEIKQNDIDKLRATYAHPDDVDLTVGGALERIMAGTASGRTFNCIMMKQMYNTRVGDRFWFETTDPLLKFSRKQLEQIRKASLARILCDNGNDITRMQRNVFRLPSEENPIVECNRIPKLNLRPWKEEVSSEEK